MHNKNIAIVDYGMGNSKSVSNMLRKIGFGAFITSIPGDLKKAKKIILPGVGSFDTAINNLQQYGLIDSLTDCAIIKKIPVLGICLGMHLFANNSEEGNLPGLCWIPGQVRKINFSKENTILKIPHMGWNTVKPSNEDTVLFKDVPQSMRFYFVHSYHFVCDNPENILATCHYGYEFTCAVKKENIYGVQFHPEKSHKFGMQVLKNFVEYA